jgi:dTDP-glucose pyrophosphorylase
MSTKEAIRQITIKPTDPIREAARVIQAQDIKFAIVCDAQGRLLGTVTDGDIRRSLLSDIAPTEPVERIMNRQPQVTRRHDDPIKLRQQMRAAVIRHLPEVDAEGHVVDIFFLDGPERFEPLPNAAVLMAGGRGERLRPLTSEKPKPMLMIGGKPVLERALEHLIDQGFRRFYFSINYLGHVVEEHFGDGSRFGVTISYLRETVPLGTAGALSQLERQQHPFLVMNGDLVTKAHVRAIMEICNAGVDAVMGAREYAYTVPYGCLEVDDTRIRNIHEKPTEHRYINAGIYGLVPDALSYVRADERLDMTELFRRLIEDRRDVRFHPIAEEWIDIGNREDLAWAERLFESSESDD